MSFANDLIVIKRDLHEQETWRYAGRLLEHADGRIMLEAFFNRPDMPFHGILLGEGDRFVETYYTDRWYNVFEIHARDDDHLRGWYCNVTRPAILEANVLSYVDLALDLLVYPDGKQLVLDEDEFEQLDLPAEVRAQALKALDELKRYFATMQIRD